ncbi:MAG: hypothetical protein AB7U41_04185, partial [Dongiaceae bacterium]
MSGINHQTIQKVLFSNLFNREIAIMYFFSVEKGYFIGYIHKKLTKPPYSLRLKFKKGLKMRVITNTNVQIKSTKNQCVRKELTFLTLIGRQSMQPEIVFSPVPTKSYQGKGIMAEQG